MIIKQRIKWIDGFSLRLKTQDEWIDEIKKVPAFARGFVASALSELW